MADEIDPPPRSEAEEIRRRSRITIRMLVEWYKQQGIPLGVPLTDYRPRGEHADSS
jgi:hypothetical protein